MSSVPWSSALLDLLKAPKTPANYAFVNSWSLREQPTATLPQSNNPFMTTAGTAFTLGPYKAGTFPKWNDLGVAKYPNLETGVFLNAYHIATQYPAIRDAIRSGNPASFANHPDFQSEMRKWSGSGYSGVMGTGGASAPMGPTVDPSRFAAVAKGAAFHDGGLNGALRHIPGVAQAEGAAGGVADAAGAVAGFIGKITDPSFILRGLQIVAGGVLVLVGTILLARQVALAADLPDPAAVAGPVGKVGKVAAAGAAGVAAQTPARREGRRAEDAAREANGGRAPRAARQGVKRKTESIDAATGRTRRQEAEARAARRASSSSSSDEIPF